METDTVTAELWQRVKMILMTMLSTSEEKSQAERYLSMITKIESGDNAFLFFATSLSVAELIKKNYGEKLSLCFNLAGAGSSVKLEFALDENFKPKPIPLPVTRPGVIVKSSDCNEVPVEKKKKFLSTIPLNDSYTFDEFVCGPSNSFAHAAAKGVVANLGKSGYNPLFIHGDTGLGKTHLMQAIGNETMRLHPNANVCYLTAEVLLNEFVNSLQNKSQEQFREKYRSIDLLLVDDIQFIAERNQFQIEFFNTFNSLHMAGRQIVMTSDVSPRNLLGFEERLISRFEGGLVQEIESPTYETRLAILRKKAENLPNKIPDDCLRFIAEKIKSHVRAMEGALSKVSMMLSVNPGVIPSGDFIARSLGDLIEKEKNIKKITVEEIQTAVSKKYGVTMAQILSSERTQSIVTPRQLAMYISRKFTLNSLPEIARIFNKSHATIIHGVKTIEKRLDVEPDLKATLEEIIGEYGYSNEDKPY